jgi:hypothetical protein
MMILQTPERASSILNGLLLTVALPVDKHATALEVLGIGYVLYKSYNAIENEYDDVN